MRRKLRGMIEMLIEIGVVGLLLTMLGLMLFVLYKLATD